MLEQLQQLDTGLFIAINSGIKNAMFDLLCPFMRKQSNWYLLYAVLGYFLYEKYRLRFLWILLGVAILVLISDQVSANLIKNTVQRLRPCNNPALQDQVRLLVPCGSGYSFISAHATNHFAIAFFISSFYKELKWVKPTAILWASLIAFSQVYVGVHYPSDVLAGALLGSLFGILAYILCAKKVETKTAASL